jgi:ethanolamine ammonia-lyase small subunit
LKTFTPARVGLGRTGVSQQTRDLLDFQLAHAKARDAVHATMNASAVAADIRDVSQNGVVHLHSAAPDRTTYLQRPDHGRKLDDASRDLLLTLGQNRSKRWDLVPVITDGLSALAVERHAAKVLKELLPRIADWNLAPTCIVEQGRVAVGDEIGEILHPQLVVVLIGERPGLSSPDSLGAYITWNPRMGRTDAERNCISNIRAEGLTCEEAAAQLGWYLAEARRRQLTGVALTSGSRQLAGDDRA